MSEEVKATFGRTGSVLLARGAIALTADQVATDGLVLEERRWSDFGDAGFV